ncbi:MAG: PAS domain-containing protein [Clostridia bacterium]|nr:PAS domain-containing protein [Clostridia bacterium]
MEQLEFYKAILDNFTDGIYILDDKGNYLFVNSAYIQALNMPKSVLLHYNVHDFLRTGQIDFCISDIVYREKRRVVMFQDVFDTQHYGRKNIRQMVISTPIFNQEGNVQNILAVVRPLDMLSALYKEASQSAVVSSLTAPGLPQREKIIAKSPAMLNLLSMAKSVADVDSAILISGESGTGKDVVARFIHQSGNRCDNKLVIINCASLPENLLEAELFGYEKGSFTGAASGGKKGLFEEADGGTLFLDEINSLPLHLQGKLLRAVETKTFQRIGSTKSCKIDFRLIAATNEDLEKLIEEKKFRADLYYRLQVIDLNLAPLRDRREDIVPLALYFLDHFCQKHNKNKVFSPQTIQNIETYDWPGNVRELKNFVERSVVISMDQVIEIPSIEGVTGGLWKASPLLTNAGMTAGLEYDLIADARYAQMLHEHVTLDSYLKRCERSYIRFALQKLGSSYKAAEALGTSQTSIIRRKKKYKL